MRQATRRLTSTVVASFRYGRNSTGPNQSADLHTSTAKYSSFQSYCQFLTTTNINLNKHCCSPRSAIVTQSRVFSNKEDGNNDNSNEDNDTIVVTNTKVKDLPPPSSKPPPYSPPPTTATSYPTKRKKSNQQQEEEEMYQLQSNLKTHYQHANFEKALTASEEILEKSMNLFEEEHPVTASAYNNLGLMHKMLGNFDESEKNYLKALDIYKAVVGEDHASSAAALHNLGTLTRTRAQVLNHSNKEDDDEEEGQDEIEEIDDEKAEKMMKERLKYNQSAIKYFDEAFKIRSIELGPSHVHTVSSRSQLGSAMAAQVVWQQTRKLNNKQEDEDSTYANELSDDGWNIAEEHLRSALKTAVENPRGEQIKVQLETDQIVPRKDKTLSKKEKRKAAKERKKIQRANARAQKLNGMTGDASILTLSAAAAAQNLAIFLKTRASLIGRGDEVSEDVGDMYVEARKLYLGALNVREELLSNYHPDTIATKFSLAELVEAMGNKDGANQLREQIMKEYEVHEKED